MDELTLKELKKQIVGKKLLSIIDLESYAVENIANTDVSSLDSIKLLLLDNNEALLFLDYDCDGYRSGDWEIFKLEETLISENVKGIKHINSEIIDLEYLTADYEDKLLIITKEYVISMGQDNSDSYYPSNFFNIEEVKDVIIKSKVKKIKLR